MPEVTYTGQDSFTPGTPHSALASGSDEMRSLTGARIESTRKWRKALASARRSATRAHVLCIGDSITQGYYGATPYHTHAWPHLVAGMFDAWVGASNDTGVIGATDIVSPPASETRFTVGGTWGFSGSGYHGRGRMGTGSATMLFSPSQTIDTFRVWYRKGTGGGTVTWSVDSGASTGSFSCSGATALAYVDIPCGSTGVHTLLITSPAATTYAFINGVEAMTGAAGGVKVSRIGYNGGKTTEAVAGGAAADGSLACFAHTAPDLTIIALGTNDYGGQTAVATFQANLTSLVTNALTTGSCLLVAEPSQSSALTIPQSDYVAAIKAVGAANGVPVLDLTDRWGTYTQANAAGFMQDGTHPNATGSYDLASAVFAAIQRIS